MGKKRSTGVGHLGINFLERLEAEAHHEEDTKAQANWFSKVSSQVGNVMLLGSPPWGSMPWGTPAMPQESGSKGTRFGRFGLACGSWLIFGISLSFHV